MHKHEGFAQKLITEKDLRFHSENIGHDKATFPETDPVSLSGHPSRSAAALPGITARSLDTLSQAHAESGRVNLYLQE